MRRTLLVALLMLLPCTVVAADMYFATKPSLSPDGQTVFFAYEGDIWSVPISGGTPTRVTAMDGHETAPRVSPD